MRITTAIATLAPVALLALGCASPAQAAERNGKVQVKLMGTAVLPDGKITSIETNAVGLPSNLQTSANDNYVPTVAIEYFFNDNFSLETICCVTAHHVTGTTGLPGAELVANAHIIPATFTLKYHFGDGTRVTPYVGAGPTYFIVWSEKPGAAAIAAGADSFKLDDHFGLALQAGVDVPLGGNLALSLDAKRYFVTTAAHWYASGTEVIGTHHKLDPWVLSLGVGYTF